MFLYRIIRKGTSIFHRTRIDQRDVMGYQEFLPLVDCSWHPSAKPDSSVVFLCVRVSLIDTPNALKTITAPLCCSISSTEYRLRNVTTINVWGRNRKHVPIGHVDPELFSRKRSRSQLQEHPWVLVSKGLCNTCTSLCENMSKLSRFPTSIPYRP